ncbi:aprataxin and PNK-like factor isoform X2 [Trichosurus vulpecula]|uniref:aprataxin and PNK-like factor isoform X2 n=1 Tax=Trichosurus vulpecula TaxID=9337 RepID=UPI00186B16C1|nr:aprataxin and PNK-like factor isoform X2 [Trichosurus vulpecula]
MAGGFELAPAFGGPRVALSPGETVIGRGPLLGITDKRISRRHAILEVVGDQLRIKPTHINPCFYQSSEKSQLLPLEKNKWHWLNPGDSFSLLVDKYIFHVFSTRSEVECTLRNSQMLDEDALLNESPTSPVNSFPATIECANSPAEPPSHCIRHNSNQCSELEETTEVAVPATIPQNNLLLPAKYRNSSEQLNSVQRKRILPSWMVQGDLNVQNLELPFAQEDNGIAKGRLCMYPTSSKRKKRLSTSENSENIEAEQDPRKECRVTDQEDCPSSSKEVSGSSIVTGLSKIEMTKAKSKRSEIPGEHIDENLHDEDCEYRTSPRGKRNKMDEYEKHVSMECSGNPKSHQDDLFQNKDPGLGPELSSDPEASSSTESKAVPQDSGENHPSRTPCIYGASCYRKNPVHFQQFSHPGDRDYGDAQVMNREEDDNRPECPYGASCYRKNPQHKIEYKHSEPSGASVLDEDSDNDGQPNEYDLNDSFLDDEEEEYEPTDEDSDWEPPNEDQEGEDIEELLKEAKKFMKRNK